MTDLQEHLALMRQLARGAAQLGRNEAVAAEELVEAGLACLTSNDARRHYEIAAAGRRFNAGSFARLLTPRRRLQLTKGQPC
jgi:hypothetical protein